MPEDDLRGIVFHAAQGDESPALKFTSRWGGEGLGISVNGGFCILTKDSLGSPLPAIAGGPGVNVVVDFVFRFAAAQNNADQVVRAGGIITLLHRGSDLIVGLSHDLSGRHSLQVVADSAEGTNVCHGNH